MFIAVLLIIIISLALGIWLMLCCLRVVRVRQALVIRDRVTGNIRRIVIGPKIVMVWPSENILMLDLTWRATHLNANDIVTSDLAVTVSVDIFYSIDPTLLQAANLDQVLPFLPEIEKIVRSWTDYILRSLATGFTTTELVTTPVHRARMESLLRHTLQDRVQPLGVRIYTIRLLFHPAPMMIEAQLAAARTKLAAQARAQALEMLAAALGPDHNVTQILPLELLQKVQGNAMAALNLSLPVASKVNELDPLTMHWMLTSR